MYVIVERVIKKEVKIDIPRASLNPLFSDEDIVDSIYSFLDYQIDDTIIQYNIESLNHNEYLTKLQFYDDNGVLIKEIDV